MEILVVRHGPAGDRAAWAKTGRRDSERPLTPDGRRRTREAAEGLKTLAEVELVATSPWTRARQTAVILGGALGAPIEECPALVPSRPLEELAEWLFAREEKRVAVVGHEPHLSRFVSWLLTGAPRPLIVLKKAQAVLIEAAAPESGKAVLLWSLPPRVQRRLS